MSHTAAEQPAVRRACGTAFVTVVVWWVRQGCALRSAFVSNITALPVSATRLRHEQQLMQHQCYLVDEEGTGQGMSFRQWTCGLGCAAFRLGCQRSQEGHVTHREGRQPPN